MNVIAMSGNDSVIINNRILADFADGEIASIRFSGEIASMRTGKNNNSIYAINNSGRQAEVNIRVIRGGADDKFLNNLLNTQNNNFAGFALMNGEFVKKIGDGKGNITSDTYIMAGGIFTKFVEAKSNTEGDTEQSVAIYTLRFSNGPRTIG